MAPMVANKKGLGHAPTNWVVVASYEFNETIFGACYLVGVQRVDVACVY